MKIIVTGATGMVGKGVLLECLDDPMVTEVLSVSRRSAGIQHPKLKELLHDNFLDFAPVSAQLAGYDACFHCMGVSSAGMQEADFKKFTYDMSMALAKEVHRHNPQATFTYVSGQGTDSTEQGRIMWARVKGKTENDLLKMGFRQAFMFRPGAIIPRRGILPSSKLYRFFVRYFTWLIHLIKWLSPKSVVDTDQIGKAMAEVTANGYDKQIITPADILVLAERRDLK